MRALVVALGVVVLAVVLLAVGAIESRAAEPPRLVYAQWTEIRLRYEEPRSYLCSADATGGAHFRLTDDPTARDAQPVFRPQGDRIAFVRAATDLPGLWTARPDGTDASRFMETAVPTWSADGSRLLVILGDGHIWSIGWPGGDRVRLTETAETRLDLAVAPDGTHVAYVRSREGTTSQPATSQLVVLRLADGRQTVVHEAGRVAEPSWSADSATLAFTSGFDVWTVAADGTGAREVTSGASAPAFSPAGDAIAFVRQDDVWTMRPDGTAQANVTRSPVEEREPAWQIGSATRPAEPVPCAIVGTDGDDVLVGSAGDDIVYGMGGNDRITTLGGDDVAYDGSGNDVVDTGAGDDDVYLAAGNNKIQLGTGVDESFFASGASGSQTVDGGPNNDRIQGGTGRDRLDGGDGNDVIHGLKGADVMRGGPGDDILEGGRGDDSLDGGPGDDRVWGGFGRRPSEPPYDYDGYDLLTGAAGNDSLFGGWQKDRLFGGTGDDRLFGGAHADHLVGGEGADAHYGETGDDLLLARDRRRETVSGGPGFDRARLDAEDRRVGVERALR